MDCAKILCSFIMCSVDSVLYYLNHLLATVERAVLCSIDSQLDRARRWALDMARLCSSQEFFAQAHRRIQ